MSTTHFKTIIPVVLSCFALLAGCGNSDSPLGADSSQQITQGADGITYMTFSPEALTRVGKIATIPAEGRTVSKTFRPDRTASMKVEDLNRRGVRDDLEVTFTVRAGELSEATTITMTVYGNNLSDLVLAFEPHGLVFNDPAQLDVKIGAKRVDRSLLDLEALIFPFSGIEGYHDHDGDVQDAPITVKTYLRTLLGDVQTPSLLLYDYAVISVEVPGFSRYGMRRR